MTCSILPQRQTDLLCHNAHSSGPAPWRCLPPTHAPSSPMPCRSCHQKPCLSWQNPYLTTHAPGQNSTLASGRRCKHVQAHCRSSMAHARRFPRQRSAWAVQWASPQVRGWQRRVPPCLPGSGLSLCREALAETSNLRLLITWIFPIHVLCSPHDRQQAWGPGSAPAA